MTLGTFATFAYALFRSYEPVKSIGGVYQQFERAHGATVQVFEFLQLQEEVSERPGALGSWLRFRARWNLTTSASGTIRPRPCCAV